MPMFYVYMLECSDKTLYTGYTDDIRKRLAVHNAGKGAKYTRSRLPCRLAYAEECENKQDAMKREWFIKHKLTRKKKLALIDQFDKHIILRRSSIMEKNLAEFVTEKVNIMMAASSCCAEAKAAGEKFLAALGTPAEAEEVKRLIAELEGDVNSIDSFIGLCASDFGKQIFGDQATAMGEAGKAAKAKGVKYCLCDACTAGGAILDRKDELL